MSLAQHVTQDEGFDYRWHVNPFTGATDGQTDQENQNLIPRETVQDNNVPEWRRKSFAPVDLTQPDIQHTAAYKISNRQRIAQVVTAVVAIWLASGIVFGFAALKPVLVAQGVYQHLCPVEDDDLKEVPCDLQDMRLNLIFIAASITANISCLLAGSALDRYGRRICWILSSVSLAIGSLLMGLSFKIADFDGYLAGYLLLSFGGTFLFVPSYQLANAFPKHSGFIVALITGAFDASAAVFLFYRLVYDMTDGAFSPSKFFFGYLLVPAMILVAEFTIMPSHSYHTISELEVKIEKTQDKTRDVHASDEEISDDNELIRVRSNRQDRRRAKRDQIEAITGDSEEREGRVKMEEERQEASGVWGVLHGVPAHKQMLTPWYILILLLTILQMLRMNYFIATIRAQYRYMLDSDEGGERINHFFDVALPIGGVLSTPFIGVLLNNLNVPTTFGLVTTLIIAIGVFNCIPAMWAGYATVVVFVIFRPLYYSTISDYATKVFGFATFGRIYGTLVCLSGLVNFAQSGLDALTHGPLKGDPTPVNVAFGVAGAGIGIALTVFVAIKGRLVARDMETDNQEGQRLLSENDRGYGARD